METIEKTVAGIILDQLGGHKFKVMTGAHNFVDCGNALMFIFKGNQKMNKCKIALTPDDLYDMDFYQLRGKDCKLVAQIHAFYNEDIQEAFRSITGLDTHL